jgi:hypothetical protein
MTRLHEAARRALDSLNDLIANTTDPGVEALGARYELATALTAAPASVRDVLLRAIDFPYAQGLGYESPDALLDAYDAARAPSADQAAGPAALREAAAFYEGVLQQSLDPDSDPRYCTAVRDIVMGLRHRADAAQQDAPWLSDSARIGRTLIWTWTDIGKGGYGQGYRAAQAEARALLTGQRDSGEAQQPEVPTFVCKCPAEICHCGHHAAVSQPGKEPS